MACHAHPCGEAAEDGGGGDVIDVEGEDQPPTPSAVKRKGRPPQGDTEPPSPPESPSYGHPAESRLADVTKERDRLATRLKTLERDLGTARKAKPPAQAGGEGGSATGVRYLLAGAQAWHAQAEACAG